MLSLSIEHMTTTLPLPYRRGAETLALVLGDDAGGETGGWTPVRTYDFAEYRARHGESPADPRYVLVAQHDTGPDDTDVEIEFAHVTHLAEAIDDTHTTLSVTPAFAHEAPFLALLGEERVRVTATAGPAWTVERGAEGTASSSHEAGAEVRMTTRVQATVPAHTPPGRSFAIPASFETTPDTRLRRLRPVGIHPVQDGREQWGIVALLGTLAKLAWVLGDEKAVVRAHLHDVARQRALPTAHGAGLDVLGRDLRVPRFPPRPYSHDSDTIALYHADEPAGATELADETARFGRPGFPGTVHGAALGAAGAFGGGIRLPGPAGGGRVEVASTPGLDVAAEESFTAEAFVRTAPREAPAVLLLRGDLSAGGQLTGAGYALTLGPFRGFQNNVRWAVRDDDGTARVLHADLDVADGSFHHVAGVIDRERGRLRLLVDGRERASADARALGAFTPAAPLRIGRRSGAAPTPDDAQHQLHAVVDEVRLSRAARRRFDPVLGESDEAYRRRLRIFEQWLVPTPGALLEAINRLVPIDGDPESFVLVEADRPGAHAERTVQVVPAALDAGEHIDADGDRTTRLFDAVASPETEPIFFRNHAPPSFLVRYEPATAVAPGTTNLMQIGVRDRLNALADRVDAEGLPGTLRITAPFDAEAQGLHRTGRAVRLTLDGLSPGDTAPLDRLAALAHRAGFAYVAHESSEVFAAIDAGEVLSIAVVDEAAPPTHPGIDIFTEDTLTLRVEPRALPAVSRLEWSVLACGPGRARFEPAPGPRATEVTLRAEAPGDVIVRVAVTVRAQTVVGTRRLRVGPERWDGEALGADGAVAPRLAEAAGAPVPAVDPRYFLEAEADADDALRHVHLAFRRALDRLRAGPAAGRLVLADPRGEDLSFDEDERALLEALVEAGRARLVQSTDIDADLLAALAHAAGFAYVRPAGGAMLCVSGDGPLLDLLARTPDGASVALDEPVEVGVPLVVTVRQAEALGAGDYFWSVHPRAAGTFVGAEAGGSAPSGSAKRFTPSTPGRLLLSALYYDETGEGTLPFSVELRLKEALDAPETIIPKDGYDLIMNVLNSFHPIGVEIITTSIRAHVRELQGDAAALLPGYTFPDYRA